MSSENSTEMVNSQPEIELKPNETPQTVEELHAELERTKSALKKANSESANHRHKAKELDDLKSKIEQEKLSETERLQARLSEQQQEIIKHQERTVRAEMKSEAAVLGFINPATASRLIDWSEIEFDESGDPINVADLLKKLAKDEPYLIGRQQSSGSRSSVSNPSRSSVESLNFDDLAEKAVKGTLTAEQYAALSPAQKQQLIKTMQKNRR